MALRMALAVTALIMGAPARASFMYAWPAAPTLSDPVEPGLGAGQDILAAWHATDGAWHYFRLDLRGVPTSDPLDHAEIYGIYIDSGFGGGNNHVFSYIPDSLSGIDFVLDSHFESTGVYERHDFHSWSPYVQWFNYRPLETHEHQESERGGATLEWRIAADAIGGDFTWWAADLNTGLPSATFDIVGPVRVPEPACVWLALSGLACSRRAVRLCAKR